MPYYHIRIKHKEPEQEYELDDFELDLSEEEARLLGEQYKEGHVFFREKWIDASNIKEIEIRETLNKTERRRPILAIADIFSDDRTNINIVTRKFVKSPPKKEVSEKQEIVKQPLSKDVFIVHGRDHRPMKELRTILEEFGLNAIILHEQPSGSRTIVEKLEKYSDVGYAFVILTPDDVGEEWGSFMDGMSEAWEELLKTFGQAMKSQEENEIEYQTGSIEELQSRKGYELSVSMLVLKECLKRRSRQNVVLEFGYFIGLLGRDRVCCLHQGNVELPSDMHGIVYIPFKESVNEAKDMIKKELIEAGYDIKK
jgi:predicted nucleotide-binding protein